MSDAAISFPIFGEGFVLNPSRSITVFGLTLYWYGIIIALGFILAVWYVLHRRKEFGLTEDNIIDILLCAVPSAIIGARLYYVLFNLDAYSNFADVFKIWEGGLAIYGGILFAVAAAVIYCMAKKISCGAMLDLFSFGLLIGQAVGRWGNFFNREAYGVSKNVENFFLRMGLTPASGETIYVHPTFLYESLWNIIGLVVLHVYSKKHRKFDGQVFALYVAWYGLGRYLIEGLRADSLYLFDSAIRVSQLLALLSCCFAILFLVHNWRHKEHTPEELYVNRVPLPAAADSAASPEDVSDEASADITDCVDGEADKEYIEEDEDTDSDS